MISGEFNHIAGSYQHSLYLNRSAFDTKVSTSSGVTKSAASAVSHDFLHQCSVPKGNSCLSRLITTADWIDIRVCSHSTNQGQVWQYKWCYWNHHSWSLESAVVPPLADTSSVITLKIKASIHANMNMCITNVTDWDSNPVLASTAPPTQSDSVLLRIYDTIWFVDQSQTCPVTDDNVNNDDFNDAISQILMS